MRDDLTPHNDVEGPDDGGPALPLSGDLARLEDAVQRLQQTLEEQDDVALWEPMRATQDAVTLAQRLLRGWQVEQAVTQACLTRWQQTLQALETAGVTMQLQAQTLQALTARRRHAPWWAFLTGVGVMGMLALSAWLLASPPRRVPPWQARPPVPMVPGAVRPSEEPPSMAPDATLAPEAHEAPSIDGP